MILVCAATGTEAACCRRGIADAGAAAAFEVLTTGVGPARAARALARRLGVGVAPGAAPGAEARAGAADRPRRAAGTPDLVVSAGFAGALGPGLERLAWITATALYWLVERRPVPVELPPGLLRPAPGAVACAVACSAHVVAGPVAPLGPPAAVDMESSALAEVAAAAGIPVTVLRLVTDTPARPLPAMAGAIGAALAAERLTQRAAHGLRAALHAARAPADAADFLRETARWREALRRGWRDRALAGPDRLATSW